MDVHSPSQRSFNMSRIRSKDTGPEVSVRSVIFNLGYRYRLHVRDLPGRPDIVFQTRRIAIFVNGCFWHSHSCRFGGVTVRTNSDRWSVKRNRTIERDREAVSSLKSMAWEVITIWECEIKNSKRHGCLETFIIERTGLPRKHFHKEPSSPSAI